MLGESQGNTYVIIGTLTFEIIIFEFLTLCRINMLLGCIVQRKVKLKKGVES